MNLRELESAVDLIPVLTGDWILAEVLQEPETTKSGIIIPEKDDEFKMLSYGNVISIGPDVKNCIVGDIVCMTESTPHKLIFNGREDNQANIFSDTDVIAVYKQKESN